MVQRRRFMGTVAALMVIALAATGCGGAKEAAAPEGGAPAGTTVKIGMGLPLTAGSVAQAQGIERGVQLAIKQANESAEAKELGLTFEGVAVDDQGDPKTAVTAANQLVSDQAVLGVVGHLNSGCSIPASKIYNESKVPMVSPASTNPALTQQGFNNVFRTCTIDSVQGPAGAEYIYGEQVGAKTAVLVDDSTPYGEGLADEFGKNFEQLGGKVAFREKTTDKESDFNALATKIKAANPDVIYYGGTYNAGSVLSKQISAAGVEAPVAGGDALFDAQYVAIAGEGAEGDMCTSVGLPTDKLPNGQAFAAAYAAEFAGEEIGAYDAYGYDAADALIRSIIATAKAQGVDALQSPAGRDAIITGVAASDFDGVTGKVAFDELGDTLNKAITLYRVEKGAWTPFIVPSEGM